MSEYASAGDEDDEQTNKKPLILPIDAGPGRAGSYATTKTLCM